MPMIVITHITGPWGVMAEYQELVNLVAMSFKYRITVGLETADHWIVIPYSPDNTIDDLDPATSTDVQNAFTAQGYELP